MRKMSFARELRVQKLQDRNRMVGKTFNPSGWTSEALDKREKEFVKMWSEKSQEEREIEWNRIKSMQIEWKGSFPWNWCAFKRNFTHNNIVY